VDAIRALQTAQRGIKSLYAKEEFNKDSTSKEGLLVAIVYMQAQVDLYEAQQGNNELHKMLSAPELPSDDPAASDDDDDDVTDTREASTNVFEPVRGQPAAKRRKE